MVMNLSRVAGAIGVATICAVAGCGGGSPAGDVPQGSVHGVIVVIGGPPDAPPAGTPGTVVVKRGGTEVARQGVREGQEFQFSLRPGKYRLSVEGATVGCVQTDVTVTAAQDQAVKLVCPIK